MTLRSPPPPAPAELAIRPDLSAGRGLARDRRAGADHRAGSADRRPAPSSVAARRPPLSARRAAGRSRHRPQRRRHRVRGMPLDVPQGRPAGAAPLGETEFVAGIAAMSASGNYGKTRVAAGIVGDADLTLGDRVEPVLLAHIRAGGGRFRGVRHSAGYDADPIIGNSGSDVEPHLYAAAGFPRRPQTPHRARAQLRRLALSPAARPM